VFFPVLLVAAEVVLAGAEDEDEEVDEAAEED